MKRPLPLQDRNTSVMKKSLSLQDRNASCSRLIINLVRPYGNLNLADVSLPQEEHADAGLADAAADSLRTLAFQ